MRNKGAKKFIAALLTGVLLFGIVCQYYGQTVYAGNTQYSITWEDGFVDGTTTVTIGDTTMTSASGNYDAFSEETQELTITLAEGYQLETVKAGETDITQEFIQNNRVYTYTLTVANQGNITITARKLYQIIANPVDITSVTINGVETNSYTKPNGSELRAVVITPAEGRAITYVSAEGMCLYADGAWSKDYTVYTDTLPEEPVGNFVTKPDQWFQPGNAISFQFQEAPTMNIQFGYRKPDDEKITWLDTDKHEPIIDQTEYAYAVPNLNSGTCEIYVRQYKKVDGTGSTPEYTVYSKPISTTISYDTAPPTMVQATIGTRNVDAITPANPYYSKAAVSVVFDAKDGELESGVKELQYTYVGDTSTELNDDATTIAFTNANTVGIPYSSGQIATPFLAYRIKDMAGNQSETQYLDLQNVKFDSVAPSIPVLTAKVDGIPITAEDATKYQTKNIVITGTMQDGAVMPAGETASGIEKVAYRINGDASSPFIDITAQADLINGTITLPEIEQDGEQLVQVRVTDRAGNSSLAAITVYRDAEGVQAPQITISGTVYDAASDVYVTAEHPTVYAVVLPGKSGISNVTCQLVPEDAGNTVTMDMQYNQEKKCYELVIPDEVVQKGYFNGKLIVSAYDNTISSTQSERIKTISRKLQMDVSSASIQFQSVKTWSNQNISVQITAQNTNSGIKKLEYYVDGKLVDTIIPSYSNMKQKISQTLTIENSSTTFAGTQIQVKSYKYVGGNPSEDNYIVYLDKVAPEVKFVGVQENAIYNSNQSLGICTLENMFEGMEPVSVTATRIMNGVTYNYSLEDYMPQSANDTHYRSFTEEGTYHITAYAKDRAGNTAQKSIDFTIDKTAPLLSITGAIKDSYNAKHVTLEFEAFDLYYQNNRIQITVDRELDGQHTISTIMGWNNSAAISKLSNTFQEDGTYTITFTAIDQAGNEAIPQTLSFTIDKTPPEIKMEGANNYAVNSNPIMLAMSVVESYYETNDVKITAQYKDVQGKIHILNLPIWTNRAKSSDISQLLTEDGKYVIWINAVDKAGNQSSQELHFTIDTKPPVIKNLEQYDGKYLQNFSISNLENYIEELSVPTVHMYLNGVDYDGSNIQEDGKYNLKIDVVDEVGNAASKSIEFVIDSQAPRVIFTGIRNRDISYDEVQLGISLEIEDDTIDEIIINGKKQELEVGQQLYTYAINEYGKYKITVTAHDEAGNKTTQELAFEYRDQSRDILLLVFLAAFLLLALGLGITIVVYKKRSCVCKH